MRLTELLKQPHYEGIATGDQTAFIFAATNGFLDEVDIADIARWKKDFGEFLRLAKGDLRYQLSRAWSEEIEARLRAACVEFRTKDSSHRDTKEAGS